MNNIKNKLIFIVLMIIIPLFCIGQGKVNQLRCNEAIPEDGYEIKYLVSLNSFGCVKRDSVYCQGADMMTDYRNPDGTIAFTERDSAHPTCIALGIVYDYDYTADSLYYCFVKDSLGFKTSLNCEEQFCAEGKDPCNCDDGIDTDGNTANGNELARETVTITQEIRTAPGTWSVHNTLNYYDNTGTPLVPGDLLTEVEEGVFEYRDGYVPADGVTTYWLEAIHSTSGTIVRVDGGPCVQCVNAVTDTDGDGVDSSTDPDDNDPCVPSDIVTACDSDGDGVVDGNDTCPNTPGTMANSGCPAPTGGLVNDDAGARTLNEVFTLDVSTNDDINCNGTTLTYLPATNIVGVNLTGSSPNFNIEPTASTWSFDVEATCNGVSQGISTVSGTASVVCTNPEFTPIFIDMNVASTNPQYHFEEDIDNDGDLDIIFDASNNSGTGDAIVGINDGSNNYTRTIVFTDSRLRTLYSFDANNDGNLDYLAPAGAGATRELLLRINDGNLDFDSDVRTIISSPDYNITGTDRSYDSEDIDGDGDIDFVVSDANGGTGRVLHWYENDGSGNFTENTLDANATFSDSPSIVDLDEDGDMDIIYWVDSPSLTNKSIVWYENDGNESFTLNTIAINNDGPIINVLDWDSDGDLDIFYGDDQVLLNDGNENFTDTGSLLGAPTEGFGINAIDLNYDGFADIVTSDDFAVTGLSIYYNDGSNGFSDKQVLISSALGTSFFEKSIIFKDLNADGTLDISAIASEGNEGVYHFYNNCISSTIPDQDADGISDASDACPTVAGIAANNGCSCTDGVQNGTETGVDCGGGCPNSCALVCSPSTNFVENILHNFTFTSPVIDVEVLDINNDNLSEVVAISSNGLGYVDNNNNYTVIDAGVTDYYALEVSDINNDNFEDILIASSINPITLKIYTNNRNGTFSNTISQNLPPSTRNATNISVGDINGDGNADILIGGVSGAWLSGNGAGVFTSPITTINELYEAILVDFDNDNDLDIIGRLPFSGIYIHTNDGNGNFTSSLTIPTTAQGVGTIIAADFDNDNDIDIAHSYYDDAKMIYSRNDIGVFTSNDIPQNDVNGLAYYDFNGDGYLDIVGVEAVSDLITIFYNDGTGSFNEFPQISFLSETDDIELVDFDNDGDMDIIYSSGFDGDIAVLLNTCIP